MCGGNSQSDAPSSPHLIDYFLHTVKKTRGIFFLFISALVFYLAILFVNDQVLSLESLMKSCSSTLVSQESVREHHQGENEPDPFKVLLLRSCIVFRSSVRVGPPGSVHMGVRVREDVTITSRRWLGIRTVIAGELATFSALRVGLDDVAAIGGMTRSMPLHGCCTTTPLASPPPSENISTAGQTQHGFSAVEALVWLEVSWKTPRRYHTIQFIFFGGRAISISSLSLSSYSSRSSTLTTAPKTYKFSPSSRSFSALRIALCALLMRTAQWRVLP